MTVTDPAVERFLNGPAPYSSGNPVPASRPRYKSAEQDLAEALEGTAPHLANTVAGLIGPARTLELAKAIHRATRLAVRRHTAEQIADALTGALALVEQGLDGIPPECEIAEQTECERCFDFVHTVSSRGLCDGCEAEIACDHSESGGCIACGLVPCDHSESLYGRCVACGMTWTQQACACAVLTELGRCVSCGRAWKRVADRGEG